MSNFPENPFPPSLNPQEPNMEALISLNVVPITTPHKDLDHVPLADKDFQIKDLTFKESPLKLHCRHRDNCLNHADKIGLWESNLSKYQFPSLHVFPKIVHYCQANYYPIMRAAMFPDQKVLFTITAESINEMLQLQPGENLTPLTFADRLTDFPSYLVPEVLKSSKLSLLKKNTCQRTPLHVILLF